MAPAVLRIRDFLYVVMELRGFYRQGLVYLPPDREQLGDLLPAPVALLRLTYSLDWISTDKVKQRIAHPPAPW